MAQTANLDARTDARLWTTTGETAHPANGGGFLRWDSSVNNAHNWDQVSGSQLTYRTPTTGALLLPNGEANGTNNWLENSADAISTFIAADTFDICVAFEPDTSNSNNATPSSNPGLIDHNAGYVGIVIKNGTVLGYVWDGAYKQVSVGISNGSAYVVRFRRDASAIYISVNGGSENSASAGNVGSLANNFRICRSQGGQYYDGKVGQYVIANGSTDLAATYPTMVSDWVTGGGGGGGGMTVGSGPLVGGGLIVGGGAIVPRAA